MWLFGNKMTVKIEILKYGSHWRKMKIRGVCLPLRDRSFPKEVISLYGPGV
jgi:hypothetical protein